MLNVTGVLLKWTQHIEFVIEDGNGYSQVIAQCLVPAENVENISYFKCLVTLIIPTLAEECECVVVDKDFS